MQRWSVVESKNGKVDLFSFSGRLRLLLTGRLTHATVFVCSYCCLKTEVSYLHATSMWSPHPDSEAACVCVLRATTVKLTVHVANGSLRVTASHLRLCMRDLSVCACVCCLIYSRTQRAKPERRSGLAAANSDAAAQHTRESEA